METLLTPAVVDALYAKFSLLSLAMARPFGVTLLCTIFAWAHLNSGLLRAGFAMALALPFMQPLWMGTQPYLAGLEGPFLLYIAKEMLIGLLLGFLVSLPFETLVAAGGVIDSYRGATVGGSSPSGEITAYGQMFIIMGLWLFASLGGFWLLADLLYRSYGVWPAGELLPPLSTSALPALLAMIMGLMRATLVMAGPAVIVMIACDLVFMISGRLGKQLNVVFLSASVKGMVMLLIAPLFALALVRLIGPAVTAVDPVETALRALLR